MGCQHVNSVKTLIHQIRRNYAIDFGLSLYAACQRLPHANHHTQRAPKRLNRLEVLRYPNAAQISASHSHHGLGGGDKAIVT